jgi:NAD(P)-dependent dehydrogenase (short-subunit alcohol dehydrogenase family)
MKEGGYIINAGSIQSFDPSSNLIAYASTKAAIVASPGPLASLGYQTRCASQRRCSGSSVDPLFPSTMPKEKVKQFGSQTVFGRAAQPAELAPLFVFLASDQASYDRLLGV